MLEGDVGDVVLCFVDASSLARYARTSPRSRERTRAHLRHRSVEDLGYAELASAHPTVSVAGHAIVCSRRCMYTCGAGRFGQRCVRSVSDTKTLDLVDLADPVMASAGGHFTIVVVGPGIAYGCGDARSGALGSACAPCSSCASPRPIPELARSRVLAVSCGTAHALFVVNSRRTLLACGLNCDGQLGVNHRRSVSAPTPVITVAGARLEGVVDVAAGLNHSLCATTAGLYAWGAASKGQLGFFDRRARLAADLVIDRAAHKIRRVAAGAAFSLALDDDGCLHACGVAGSGALGVGVVNTKTVKLFTRLPLFDKCTAVAAGYAHAAATTTSGELWTWGGFWDGHRSPLGHPASASPQRAELPPDAFAVEVAAGGTPEPHASTTLVACRDGTVLVASGGRYIPGSGSRFEVLLPAHRAPADEAVAAAKRDDQRRSASAYCFAGVF